MSNYTRLPIDTIEGALAYADRYVNVPEDEYEPDDAADALETLAAEVRRLRQQLAG